MSSTSPLLGLIFHWIGGFAAASFYIPYRNVKRWSWETMWLTGGVFSWILAPTIFALLLVPHVFEILQHTQPKIILESFMFGALWGIGGLTFGLTMRYLGIALGMSVALGFCTVFGTLVPPIFDHSLFLDHFAAVNGHRHLVKAIIHTKPGLITLLGVLVTVIGIAVAGMAGKSKESELSDEQKQASTKEFNFAKGISIAAFSGIMSSCFAYGLAAGQPIADATDKVLAAANIPNIWDGLPKLIIILLGGFTTNFIWCMILSVRNKSGHEYLVVPDDTSHLHLASEQVVAAMSLDPASESNVATAVAAQPVPKKSPQLLINYAFAALAGVTWYLQFFFYTMGQAKLGKPFAFTNFTIHMASIIIFSTLWGIALHEWAGTSKRTHTYIALGLFLLVGATVIIGYSNYLAQ